MPFSFKTIGITGVTLMTPVLCKRGFNATSTNTVPLLSSSLLESSSHTNAVYPIQNQYQNSIPNDTISIGNILIQRHKALNQINEELNKTGYTGLLPEVGSAAGIKNAIREDENRKGGNYSELKYIEKLALALELQYDQINSSESGPGNRHLKLELPALWVSLGMNLLNAKRDGLRSSETVQVKDEQIDAIKCFIKAIEYYNIIDYKNQILNMVNPSVNPIEIFRLYMYTRKLIRGTWHMLYRILNVNTPGRFMGVVRFRPSLVKSIEISGKKYYSADCWSEYQNLKDLNSWRGDQRIFFQLAGADIKKCHYGTVNGLDEWDRVMEANYSAVIEKKNVNSMKKVEINDPKTIAFYKSYYNYFTGMINGYIKCKFFIEAINFSNGYETHFLEELYNNKKSGYQVELLLPNPHDPTAKDTFVSDLNHKVLKAKIEEINDIFWAGIKIQDDDLKKEI